MKCGECCRWAEYTWYILLENVKVKRYFKHWTFLFHCKVITMYVWLDYPIFTDGHKREIVSIHSKLYMKYMKKLYIFDQFCFFVESFFVHAFYLRSRHWFFRFQKYFSYIEKALGFLHINWFNLATFPTSFKKPKKLSKFLKPKSLKQIW